MNELMVDEKLWASSIMPEGTVVKWLIRDGATVIEGHPLVVVRIEDALHTIVAPMNGRLSIIAARNYVVGPGSLLATLASSDVPLHA
jgi:pyruvate/2-oxoglutarate dehydrogenase complex dihydrolipoamide acyltransferase (E2) component